MRTQKTQTQQSSDRNRANPPMRTTDLRQRSQDRFNPNLTLSLMNNGATRSGLLPMQQNILMLQRTIGNRAVGRLITQAPIHIQREPRECRMATLHSIVNINALGMPSGSTSIRGGGCLDINNYDQRMHHLQAGPPTILNPSEFLLFSGQTMTFTLPRVSNMKRGYVIDSPGPNQTRLEVIICPEP